MGIDYFMMIMEYEFYKQNGQKSLQNLECHQNVIIKIQSESTLAFLSCFGMLTAAQIYWQR